MSCWDWRSGLLFESRLRYWLLPGTKGSLLLSCTRSFQRIQVALNTARYIVGALPAVHTAQRRSLLLNKILGGSNLVSVNGYTS